MDRDIQLKNLLTQGRETASAGFTENILKKIEQLSSVTTPYQPLVSDNIKKGFLITFASVVSMILLLCLIIKASQLTFTNAILLPRLSAATYYNIFVFILTFWLMFSINTLIQKNRFKLY